MVEAIADRRDIIFDCSIFDDDEKSASTMLVLSLSTVACTAALPLLTMDDEEAKGSWNADESDAKAAADRQGSRRKDVEETIIIICAEEE